MKVEYDQIIKNLKNRQLESTAARVQACLNQLNVSCMPSDSKQNSVENFDVFVGRLLRACGTLLQENADLTTSEAEEIAVAVKLSCEAFQTRSNLGSEGVQLEFSLYHIIIGLLRMKCYEWAILLAVQLKSFLMTSDNKIVSTIVHNCYVIFWNSAVEVEQKIEKLFLEDGRHRQALQLRCTALQFLCLKVEEAKNVAEKARKAMLWFLTNSNDQQEVEPDLANKFFFSILHSIVQSVIKHNDSCLSLVSVLLGVLLDWNITMYRHCSNSSYKFELTSQWVAIKKDLVSIDIEEVSRLLKKCIELVDAVTQVLIPQESYLEKQRSLKQVDNYESIVKLISSEFSRTDLLLQTLDSCSNIVFDFVKELGNSESNTQCSPGVSLAILPVLKLHMKLLVRQQETDLLSVNQLLTQTRCKVFTASLRLLRELVYQSQESKTWKAVVQDVLEEAKNLENGLDLLVGDSNTFSNSLMLSGTEAGNLGIIFFNQSCYQEAVPFLDLSCKCLTSLIERSDLTSELMKSCTDSLFKKFELLAQCYCQIGNLKEALAAVVKGLKWNMNKLNTAIEIWLKVKREAFRKNNKDIIKITIQHQLDKLGITVDRLDQVELLQAELIGYKGERYDAVDACYAVVLALLQISETNLEKGFVLTELAELIWSHNFPFKWTAAECSQRAVDLLEEVIKMSDLSEFQMVQAKLQLASSYFWLYETRIQELQKVSQEEVKKSPISSLEDKQETNRLPQGDEDDKDDVCDINPAYPHVNLQLEIESLKPLDSALNLWKDVFLTKNGVQQVIVKDKQIIEYIKTAAELYAVLQHIYQEIQALHVLQQSAHLLNNHSEEIYSISRLVHILSKFKMLDVAETLVKKGEDLLKEITDAQTLSLQLPILQSRFMLAYLEFLYHSGKFDTGHKLLKQFDSSSLWEKNTKTTMLLQAETKLVACLFNLLPSSAFSNGSIQRDDCASKNKLFPENPTILALDAWKVCMGLIKYLSSTEAQKSCKDYLSYKPALLHTLLSSTMLVGQLYIDVGAPREARCYLKDTLKVAQEMALACRSAEFLLTLANLDALCENINDCRVKLNGVEYILHTSLPATSVNYQVVREKDELSDGSDEEDFLVRRPGRSLRGTVREQLLHGHQETGSSPVSQQRVKTSIPTQWEHSISCCCNLCQHIKLHSLELEIVGLQAYCLAAMGSCSQAIRWLKDVLKLVTFLTDKVDSLLSSAVKMISINNNVANKQKYGKTNSVIKNTSFLLPLSKIRSELARLYISDGNHQWALKEIKLSLVELKENLQPFYVSNMYALILYQQAILRLQMCGAEGYNFMNISNNVWFIKTVESNAPDAYVSPIDEISKNIAKNFP
ncbi:uncharacterized protein LOC143225078 [Tachypleus tridentatus]|uniref:uncharacterized protein LOC143225078 n=1 Tax=Tachypleus tridentatus TaxID=6853 RepID=UPI003FD6BB9E